MFSAALEEFSFGKFDSNHRRDDDGLPKIPPQPVIAIFQFQKENS